MGKILITGSLGQIGSELSQEIGQRYGFDQIIATDIRNPRADDIALNCDYFFLDVTDFKQLNEFFMEHKISTIYHLAAILSATAEENPQVAWKVNISGLYNVLEIAREYNCRLFLPSSIGAFGPTTPKKNTPQDTVQRPITIYGVTKVSGELLCDYYFKRFGVDTRGLRYPGIISYQTLPGGGTTDYAVEIYYSAVQQKHYTCYIKAGTYLDMIYMPDAIRAAVDLMEAESTKLNHRNSYNITAMSIDPEMLAASIRKIIPDFTLDYNIDPIRQQIADSWPDSIDDSMARQEWGWQPQYDLDKMTADMIENLRQKINSATERSED
jgi:nucleoside-diphosphate-sugar epimerase